MRQGIRAWSRGGPETLLTRCGCTPKALRGCDLASLAPWYELSGSIGGIVSRFGLIALALVAWGCAPLAAGASTAVDQGLTEVSGPVAEIDNLNEAAKKFANRDFHGAKAMLLAIVASANFQAMSPRQQYLALEMLTALQVEDQDKESLANARRLTTMSEFANGNDWQMRLSADGKAGDDADALATVTVIAQRWPASLDQVSDEFIERLSYRTGKQAALAEARFNMLLALKAAFWRPTDVVDSPDAQWVELTKLLLKRGRLQEAKAVAEGISDYGAVNSMMLDRTFDIVTEADPDRFNLQHAWNRQIARLRIAMKEHPDKLEAVNELTLSLINDGQGREALALTDAAIAKAKPTDGSASAYTDMGELNWTYDRRAYALRALGRTDEAIAQMKLGAARPENGDVNVSQQLNLAEIEQEFGRPAEAKAVLADVDPQHTSPYGRMTYEGVRTCASAQLGDQDSVRSALSYMQAHKSDALSAYLDALVCAGDVPTAAKVAIEMLKDPEERSGVLQAFQEEPTDPNVPAPMQAHDRLMQQVYQRPDVKAAADAVGRHLILPAYLWDS